MLKLWYKWLCRHTVGVMRALYAAPLVAVITMSEAFLYFVVLSCCAISLTFPLGRQAGWDKEA